MAYPDYPDWDQIRNSYFTRTRWFPLFNREEPSFLGCPIAIDKYDLVGADAVIIGAPYTQGWETEYAGTSKELWRAAPKRVRQQSIRYRSGYVQGLDLDILDQLRVVDYGDARLPEDIHTRPSVDNVLNAQASVEQKVSDVLEVGAVPIVIGQSAPLGSYALAKPIGERTSGSVGVISLDTHWDAEELDKVTADARVAGGANWKTKLYRDHDNFHYENLVEIGQRGMIEDASNIRKWLVAGVHFYPVWKIRTELGIEGLCRELDHAYAGTEAVSVHFDMDVLGGAGAAPGDLLGELAEPMGLTDYEVIRIAHEIGKRGLDGLAFSCIPPGSAVSYRTIVYVIVYLLAGMALAKGAESIESS